MTTLTTVPMAPLLERLFAQNDALSVDTLPAARALTPEEQQRLMQSKTDYIALYSQLKTLPLAVSRKTGALLYMLARSCKARHIVEFGTSFGISTLHLAAALKDNGGGRLITTEFEADKVRIAHRNLTEGGVDALVEIREGDALQTLRSGLPEHIDLLLLDGAKALYPEILALITPHLKPGALVIADDANMSPEYLAQVRNPQAGWLSVPFADDVELSLRIQ